jgi:ribosomal protein S27E
MAFVYFKCDCDKSLAVDVSDAGHQVQCPDCGKLLLVPSPELYWTCACGEKMSAPKNLAGVSVQCAACEAEHTVPVRLALKRDRLSQVQQSESQFDVQRVPVGRTNEVQCPKCGYMSPPVLARCPQCQNYLRKGPAILRQCVLMVEVIFIISLGWFLAAHFLRISGYVKSLFSRILE